MRKPHPADVWNKQSENDLLYAKAAFRDGFWAHVCFLCQQASEKALKSLILRRAKAFPMTHSLVELLAILRINGNLRIAATVLDQYYVTARYPLGMTALAPYELLTSAQAKQALQFAAQFLTKAKVQTRKSHRKRR